MLLACYIILNKRIKACCCVILILSLCIGWHYVDIHQLQFMISMQFSSNFCILTQLFAYHITIIFCRHINQASQFILNQKQNQKCLTIVGSLCVLWDHNFCWKCKVCTKIKSVRHVTSLLVKHCLLQGNDQIQRAKWSTTRRFCGKNEFWHSESYDFGDWNYS